MIMSGKSRIAEMHPAYFALAMATGIVHRYGILRNGESGLVSIAAVYEPTAKKAT